MPLNALSAMSPALKARFLASIAPPSFSAALAFSTLRWCSSSGVSSMGFSCDSSPSLDGTVPPAVLSSSDMPPSPFSFSLSLVPRPSSLGPTAPPIARVAVSPPLPSLPRPLVSWRLSVMSWPLWSLCLWSVQCHALAHLSPPYP